MPARHVLALAASQMRKPQGFGVIELQHCYFMCGGFGELGVVILHLTPPQNRIVVTLEAGLQRVEVCTVPEALRDQIVAVSTLITPQISMLFLLLDVIEVAVQPG